jgi:exosortase
VHQFLLCHDFTRENLLRHNHCLLYIMPLLVLLSIVACVVGTQYSAVADLTSTALRSTAYQHCLLVPAITGWFIWRQRHRLHVQFSPVAGLVVLLAAWSMQALGVALSANIAIHTSVWLGMVGACVMCLGWQQCRTLWAPLAFLLFMIPFGDFLIPYLQQLFAVLSTAVLQIVGVDIVRDGLLLKTASAGNFVVAEACAGLRFLIANLMVGALFAYLSFKTSRYSIVFLVLCLLVPLVGNLLRICGVIGIAVASGGDYGVGFDHLVYGWGFFSVLMFANLYWGGLLAEREQRALAATAHSAPH